MLNQFNECSTLKEVVICVPPTDLPYTYQDCLFTAYDRPADPLKALENYHDFKEALSANNIKVRNLIEYLSPEFSEIATNCPNRIFTRDFGTVIGKSFVKGQSQLPARQLEFLIMHRAIENLIESHYPTARITELSSIKSLECGDVIFLEDGVLLINFGYRSILSNHVSVIGQLQPLFDVGLREILILRVPAETGLVHLDLAMNIICPNVVIALKSMRFQLVEIITQECSKICSFETYLQSKGYKIIWLTEGDTPMLNNFIHLNPIKLMCNSAYRITLQKLVSKYDVEVIGVDVGELEKGGGSIRCLTLPLVRA